MNATLSLSDAKARLSELVREARNRGEETIITVDGEAAARLVPVERSPRALSSAELAAYRALMASLSWIERPDASFDAVELVAEGRR